MREDAGLEEAVAREAVRAVQAGAGDFADGVEAGQAGGAVFIGLDAAALVVRGGDDGDGLACDVEAEAQAGLVDIREALADEFGGLVRDPPVRRTEPMRLMLSTLAVAVLGAAVAVTPAPADAAQPAAADPRPSAVIEIGGSGVKYVAIDASVV